METTQIRYLAVLGVRNPKMGLRWLQTRCGQGWRVQGSICSGFWRPLRSWLMVLHLPNFWSYCHLSFFDFDSLAFLLQGHWAHPDSENHFPRLKVLNFIPSAKVFFPYKGVPEIRVWIWGSGVILPTTTSLLIKHPSVRLFLTAKVTFHLPIHPFVCVCVF